MGTEEQTVIGPAVATARGDAVVLTSLAESRLLMGNQELFERFFRRLKRAESRLRAEGETFRSRVAEARDALKGLSAMLETLPTELPADEEPAEGT